MFSGLMQMFVLQSKTKQILHQSIKGPKILRTCRSFQYRHPPVQCSASSDAILRVLTIILQNKSIYICTDQQLPRHYHLPVSHLKSLWRFSSGEETQFNNNRRNNLLLYQKMYYWFHFQYLSVSIATTKYNRLRKHYWPRISRHAFTIHIYGRPIILRYNLVHVCKHTLSNYWWHKEVRPLDLWFRQWPGVAM